MATVIKLALMAAFVSLSIAAEPEPVDSDSIFFSDTSFVVQLEDSTSLDSHSVTSGWLLPLSIIGATAGVFIVLFTARSK